MLDFAADVNLLKVPADLSDEKVLLLSDVLSTAWHATELGSVSQGDRVAIWGAGPGERPLDLTLMTSQCASQCKAIHSSDVIRSQLGRIPSLSVLFPRKQNTNGKQHEQAVNP